MKLTDLLFYLFYSVLVPTALFMFTEQQPNPWTKSGFFLLFAILTFQFLVRLFE